MPRLSKEKTELRDEILRKLFEVRNRYYEIEDYTLKLKTFLDRFVFGFIEKKPKLVCVSEYRFKVENESINFYDGNVLHFGTTDNQALYGIDEFSFLRQLNGISSYYAMSLEQEPLEAEDDFIRCNVAPRESLYTAIKSCEIHSHSLEERQTIKSESLDGIFSEASHLLTFMSISRSNMRHMTMNISSLLDKLWSMSSYFSIVEDLFKPRVVTITAESLVLDVREREGNSIHNIVIPYDGDIRIDNAFEKLMNKTNGDITLESLLEFEVSEPDE